MSPRADRCVPSANGNTTLRRKISRLSYQVSLEIAIRHLQDVLNSPRTFLSQRRRPEKPRLGVAMTPGVNFLTSTVLPHKRCDDEVPGSNQATLLTLTLP